MQKYFVSFYRVTLLALVCFTIMVSSGFSIEQKSHGIPKLAEIVQKAAENATAEKPGIALIPKGNYHFYADQCEKRELYISNGLQQNPRYVGMTFANLKNVIIDFQGSEILTHGMVLPIVMENCENCTIRNCVIDSPSPLVQQIEIIQNDKNGIVFKPEPWVRCQVAQGTVVFESDLWRGAVTGGMAFNKKTKHILHNVSGINANFTNVRKNEDGTFTCPNWKDGRLVPGTAAVLRPFIFPIALFLVNNVDTTVQNVKIYYAHAKAVIAQLCKNVHLDGVSICLRGPDDPRCFTANADSTHFSCCEGKIIVENGLFEGAMDDAINVHGMYTKVVKRVNDKTIHLQFMGQGSWGYQWVRPGDFIQFIQSKTMDHFDGKFKVVTVKPVDKPSFFGAKVMEVTVNETFPDFVQANGTCGVENTAWNPDVIFRNNVMRNNRARGTLFSTSGSLLIENNLFDHVSGTAILLCGDCNFWYESGPCRNVVIRKNKFVNCMGAFYQYCNAIISIFPEIPDFAHQKQFYYGGRDDAIVIEDNEFDTFDIPLLYARSIDGLTFRKNTIRHNTDYPRVSPIKVPFYFEMGKRIRIYDNDFDNGFDPKKDIKAERVTGEISLK